MKVCSKCKSEQPLNNFWRCAKSKDGRWWYCKVCSRKLDKGYKLTYRYKITQQDKDWLLLSQGGRCAVCGTNQPMSHGWCMDHNHSTNELRGIVCHLCNYALGFIEGGKWWINAPDIKRYLDLHS